MTAERMRRNEEYFVHFSTLMDIVARGFREDKPTPEIQAEIDAFRDTLSPEEVEVVKDNIKHYKVSAFKCALE